MTQIIPTVDFEQEGKQIGSLRVPHSVTRSAWRPGKYSYAPEPGVFEPATEPGDQGHDAGRVEAGDCVAYVAAPVSA